MIGQKQVINNINELIDTNKLPHFLVITGQRGQGKTTVIKYIANKLEGQFIEIEPKVDNIRDMKDIALKICMNVIFDINNGDKMSQSAANSLLKITEECPENVYICLELQQIENTLETIKSRCREIKMESYTDSELLNFLPEEISEEDRIIITDIASNKYQIDLLIKYGVKEFYNYVNKVVDNIYKVQSANSFKISEKIDLKDDESGYDLHLFFITFRVICFEKAQLLVDSYDANNQQNFRHLLNSCDITAKYMLKLNINGINKQMLIDNWILDIRKEWLK